MNDYQDLHAKDVFTKAQVDIHNHFRLLWEQHGLWTRAAISSLVFGLPDVEPVVARLLRNPVDFGNALSPFYGNEIADRFRDLLTDHLVVAADLVVASKEGNQEAAAEARRIWYANAEAIAALLGSINPFWSEEQWRIMLFQHLALVEAEAVYMLTAQYETGVAVHDDIEMQALEMADVMARGIILQFHIR